MTVNKKLLPVKGHFFFFNAGTAPLVPYLSTYARQLGFSSSTVGLIYTVLPIFGLIAKPLFGVIADRFKIQKPIFILFQIITIISFSAIYFVPENRPAMVVSLDCDERFTVLKSCYSSPDEVDACKVSSLGNLNKTSSCQMNCDMTSPKMWQTVCEHWQIPQYCYSYTNSLQYKTVVNSVKLHEDRCIYMSTGNVTLDGYEFQSKCHVGDGYVDISEPCSIKCSDDKLSTAIGNVKANMTCKDDYTKWKLCDNSSNFIEFDNKTMNIDCQATCELDTETPWRLMEICDWWKADVTKTCAPRTIDGGQFPSNLSFTATILLHTTISEHECVYTQLQHIKLPDGSVHHPFCVSKTQYQLTTDLFSASCEINCDNTMVNEIFEGAIESTKADPDQFTSQFWFFFLLMIISWIGQAVVVTFADAICFNILGAKLTHYGKQRLWGSVGWGIFSLVTGALIDNFSDGAYKDYTVAFVLMFVFMTGDVIVSSFLKIESTKMSMSILGDIGTLLTSLPTFIFLLWTIAVGLCTGLLWQFLFWLLEDVSNLTCDGSNYIKTLQGLVSAIQTFCGEIPFLFVSGYILRKVGHVNMMSLVLFAFGVRFILYSFLSNPWYVLPIEMLQGITFGMFYPTMTSYASVVSPPGTETTVQGLVGAVFEGVGTSLGSFIGGHLYGTYGGWITFRAFGIGSLVCCGLHILLQYIFKERINRAGNAQGNIFKSVS